MKYLLLFLVFLLSQPSFAVLISKKLSCSQNGTDIIFINGISWGRDDVMDILHKKIERSIPKNYLDESKSAENHVGFSYSYNHTDGFLRDMLESAVQKISQNYNISADHAFVAAYYFTYKGIVAAEFIGSIFDTRAISFSELSDFLISYFSPTTLGNMIKNSSNLNSLDTINLKNSISKSLLGGKKLILITESQGNFFAKQAILDFQNGENLRLENKIGQINDYFGIIGQLQIAPPTMAALPKNKVVLNDKDIINLVFFERPDSNFNLVLPVPDLRGDKVDRFANHYITSTYLNSESMTTGNLSALREFTLQSVVDLASKLESNCFNAVIDYEIDNLTVNFDSTDPENPEATGLTYHWNFGDGRTLITRSKTISHSYREGGVYRVSLIVSDEFGETDSANVELLIEDVPSNVNITHALCHQWYNEERGYFSDDGSVLGLGVRSEDPNFDYWLTVTDEAGNLINIRSTSYQPDGYTHLRWYFFPTHLYDKIRSFNYFVTDRYGNQFTPLRTLSIPCPIGEGLPEVPVFPF